VALCHVQMAESQQRLAAQAAVFCAPGSSRRRNRAPAPRISSQS